MSVSGSECMSRRVVLRHTVLAIGGWCQLYAAKTQANT